MTYQRKEVIGSQTLYLGDCLEVMPTLGRVDAVVTDPPYGIGYDGQKGGRRGASYQREYEFKGWDHSAPDVKWILRHTAIVWGGNYFGLPASGKWLVWDKMQNFSGADCELAWTNISGSTKTFRMCRAQAYGAIDKRHPTQKPLPLMEWCLGFLPDARTILDPFMGSGTTLVACQKLGRHGIGIEIDPEYFEIACRRVEEAARQPDLFIEPTPKPIQEGFDL